MPAAPPSSFDQASGCRWFSIFSSTTWACWPSGAMYDWFTPRIGTMFSRIYPSQRRACIGLLFALTANGRGAALIERSQRVAGGSAKPTPVLFAGEDAFSPLRSRLRSTRSLSKRKVIELAGRA